MASFLQAVGGRPKKVDTSAVPSDGSRGTWITVGHVDPSRNG